MKKKIFAICLVFILLTGVFSLAACNNDDLKKQIDELKSQVEQLQNELNSTKKIYKQGDNAIITNNGFPILSIRYNLHADPAQFIITNITNVSLQLNDIMYPYAMYSDGTLSRLFYYNKIIGPDEFIAYSPSHVSSSRFTGCTHIVFSKVEESLYPIPYAMFEVAEHHLMS